MAVLSILSFISQFFTFSYFIVFVVALIYLYYRKSGKSLECIPLPPGPVGLPFLGNLHQLGRLPHKNFVKWGNQFGSIFKIYLGNEMVVVLNDFASIKEAFTGQADNFSGRPKFFMFDYINEFHGIIFTEGNFWKEHRRFVLSTLRDFGFGKTAIEDIIKDELTEVIELINKEKNPFNIRNQLGVSITNIISSISFGKRFNYSDKKFHKFIEMSDEFFTIIGNTNLLNFCPWMRFIPGATVFQRLKQLKKEFFDFSENMIQSHLDTFDENNIQDFTDSFIVNMKKAEHLKEMDTTFTRLQLKIVILNLFFAGSETTATTIRWGLVYLMLNPSIQEKVQKEIDVKIGAARMPSYADQVNMPYTEAVLNEIHRCSSLAPLSIPHCNIEATTLRGYCIPKRTIIMPNLWAVHYDPKYWPHPDKFDPNRFLEKDGTLRKNVEGFIPFGVGKRACLGESLARMEFFLFMTTLLQRFTFKFPDEGPPSEILEPVSGITLCPRAYNLVASPRT